MDKNDSDRRLLWALIATMAVLYVWSTFFAPKPAPHLATPAPAVASAPGPAPVASGSAAALTPVSPAPAVAAEDIPDRTLPMKSAGWTGALSSHDGSLHGLSLLDYHSEPIVTPIWRWGVDKAFGRGEAGSWAPYAGGGDPETLLSAGGSFALAGAGPLEADTRFEVSQDNGAWVAQRALPSGLAITKRFAAGPTPNTLAVDITFLNGGSAPVSGLWVGAVEAAHKLDGRFDDAILPVAYADGGLLHLEDPSKVQGDARVEKPAPLQWFGLSNRYFLSVMIPKEATALRMVFDELPDGRAGVFAVDDAALAPGASRTLSFTAYLGPKQLTALGQLGQNLDKAVEYGMFGFFSKILLFFLEVFQKGVANWGVAIILLTVFVKLLFFPLTQKSMTSGRRMQAIQPQVNALKEKYKDDSAKQQQEMMKLFSENNVNPLGGCLPMLIQLPVWFGLYSCLLYSVELYNSSFLYLRDLTGPDPYAVLPTIVALLYFLQQQMTPMGTMDPAQQKMMKLMPLLFAFLMYSFPSGLVLYIAVNTILSILQMWVINRSIPARPAAA